MSELRIGHGYDVHKLVEGRRLIIGGVDIPHTLGLLGHSDADVLLHAIMDAIIGALGLGDIGKHFPDTSDEFSGISSMKLLERVKKMLDENVPFSVSDLLVDGNDLFAFPTLPPNKRGECLNELLLQCAYSPSQFNTKEKQLKFIDTYTRRLSRGLQS